MHRRALLLGGLAVTTGSLWAVRSLPPWLLQLRPPHRVSPSRAILSSSLRAYESNEAARTTITSIDDAIDFSLHATGRWLRFALGHPTRLRFDKKPRKAHCIEYAHLFSALFGLAASHAKLGAVAYAVHSAEARALGRQVAFRGWKDHDWALIVDKKAQRRWYVDPTLFDMGFSWNIEKCVVGKVKT